MKSSSLVNALERTVCRGQMLTSSADTGMNRLMNPCERDTVFISTEPTEAHFEAGSHHFTGRSFLCVSTLHVSKTFQGMMYVRKYGKIPLLATQREWCEQTWTRMLFVRLDLISNDAPEQCLAFTNCQTLWVRCPSRYGTAKERH